MQSTAQDLANRSQINLTKDNILDPDININLGTQYISSLLNKYDSIEVALAAYNAGSGNVDKWIKNGTIKSDGSDIENIPYKETNTYVRKIMRDYKIYNDIDDGYYNWYIMADSYQYRYWQISNWLLIYRQIIGGLNDIIS